MSDNDGGAARIGLLSPNLRQDRLVDVRAILPATVVLTGYDYPVSRYTDGAFDQAETAFWEALDGLAEAQLGCLVITGELFLSRMLSTRGEAFLTRVRSIAGCPVVTMTQAVADAFADLAIRDIAVASPFPEAQTRRHVEFLTDQGFNVVASSSLGFATTERIWALPPESADQAVAELGDAAAHAHGVYLPCNVWRVIPRLQLLERRYRRPMVANSPAWIRAALKQLGLEHVVPGYGALLSRRGSPR